MGERREDMENLKRGRGRPKKDGAKRKRINLLVSDEFYNDLKEFSELEGVSRTDYIIDSVSKMGALTRIRHEQKEVEEEEKRVDEDYEEHEDCDFEDEWE